MAWNVLNETLLIYTPTKDLPKSTNVSTNTNILVDKTLSFRTICAFDFDGTLVTQKSGKKYPIDSDDWKPLYDNDVIKNKLKKLYEDERIIVIFSNQSGVSKKKLTIDQVKDRFNNFLAYMNNEIPIFIHIALADDHYRKPATGMWVNLLKSLEEEIHTTTQNEMKQKMVIQWDFKNSVFVGDAAGRKGDFACSDRKFAYNVGIDFHTPETFFLNDGNSQAIEVDWEWGGFDPIPFKTEYDMIDKIQKEKLMEQQERILQNMIEDDDEKLNNTSSNFANNTSSNTLNNTTHNTTNTTYNTTNTTHNTTNATDNSTNTQLNAYKIDEQEIVLLVGPPSSGKSTLCSNLFPTYVNINMDTLNTKAKCLKAAKAALNLGKSIIVDNTNPTKKGREEYISLAKDYPNLKVRCIIMDVPKELALHLNMLRVKLTEGKRKKNPTVAYNMYYKNFEVPEQSEGITEIIRLQFAITFNNDLHKKYFFERT